MKKLAKILFVALLLLGAGKTLALDLTLPNEIVFPPGTKFPPFTTFPITLEPTTYTIDSTGATFPNGLTLPAGTKYLNVPPNATGILALDPGRKILTPEVLQANISGLQTYVNDRPTNDPARQDLANLQLAVAQINSGSVNNPYDPTGNQGTKSDLPICFSWSGGFEVKNCLLQGMAAVGELFVWLFGWLVIWANQLFNIAIDISVRNFSLYANLEGVNVAWRISRDLVNLSLIFVLLYVAIGTILNLDSVRGKHLLKNVIIAALLVNFSAVFTKIVIDASNVVANALYTLAAGGHNGSFGAPDVGTRLLKLNAESIFNGAWGQLPSQPAGNYSWWDQFGAIIGSYFGQTVMVLITSTVLLAGALMFFARTIVLIFVIALSPLAFLGFAVGGELSKLSNKWKDGLVNQVIFAPVYLLLIYMTIELLNSGGETGLRGLVSTASGGTGIISALVVFAIVNGMMIGSLIVAKTLSVAGAAAATKFGGNITGFGAKFLGRTSAGLVGGTTRSLYGGIKQTFTGKDSEGNKASRLRGLSTALISSPTSGLRAGAEAGTQVIKSEGRIIRAAKEAIKKPGQFINEQIAGATGISILGKTRDDEREARKRAKDDKEASDAEKLDETRTELIQIANKLSKRPPDSASNEEKTEFEKKRKEIKDKVEKTGKDIVKIDSETLKKLAEYISDGQMEILSGKDGIAQDKFKTIKEAREAPLVEALKSKSRDSIARELGPMTAESIKEFMAGLSEATDEFTQVVSALDSSEQGQKILNQVVGDKRTTLDQVGRIVAIRGDAQTSPAPNIRKVTSTIVTVDTNEEKSRQEQPNVSYE